MGASKTGLPDPTLAAEKLLSKLDAREPPVDLSKVVSLWPNLFLTESELDGAGYLLPIGELGAEILVNEADADERKRFTVAHELGHWVLGLTLKKKYGHFSQPKDAHYAEVERWCDRFATNLLMPEFMIKSNIHLADPKAVIEELIRAASKFKVSDSAIFIRLWEVLRVQVALITLRNVRGRNEALLDRSFADSEAETALKRILKLSQFIEAIMCSPVIYMSSRAAEGKVEYFGRRISPERVLLAVKWP
jgi:hypothetical protein